MQDNDLRKRRRLNKEQVTPAAVAQLSDERYLESFDGGEVSKKEYFLFHNLPWPPAAKTGLLSLSQGKFLLEQRMKDLDFLLSDKYIDCIWIFRIFLPGASFKGGASGP